MIKSLMRKIKVASVQYAYNIEIGHVVKWIYVVLA